MVGRKVLLRVDKTPARPGEPVLEVRGLDVVDGQGVRRVKDVSFAVRAGEIVGIAGVSGNGQSELLAALAGIVRPAAGDIAVGGTARVGPAHVDAGTLRALGVGHVPGGPAPRGPGHRLHRRANAPSSATTTTRAYNGAA